MGFDNRAEMSEENSPAAMLPGLLLIVYVLMMVRTAWLCDDAFITFRTVDNFIHGRGLTWNPGERVWVYTHTLWMWVLAVASFVTREIPNTALLLCIATSAAAAGMLAFRAASGPAAGALALAVLILSRSFTDYSTAGLENPLSHLLLAAMMVAWMRPAADARRLFAVWFVGGLGMLTRHDLLLLFGPAMVAEFLRTGVDRKLRLRWALLGVLPFVLWEIFALFYYGFPVPNTAFAKLNNGIPGGELFRQGLVYYIVSLQWDPLIVTILAAGVVAGLRKSARRELWPFAAGIVLYCLYLLKIGGDFMAGRFLTAPAFAALLILARTRIDEKSPLLLLRAGAIVLLGLAAQRPVQTIDRDYGRTYPRKVESHGIADERSYYHGRTALSTGDRTRFANPGEDLTNEFLAKMKMETFVSGAVGMTAFYAGSDVHIIDAWALGDALISHLPARNLRKWRIGHYERLVPPGYFDTVDSGENRIQDPDLAEYYDRLNLVVSGPLLAPGRLKEIARFNLGMNESLIDVASYRTPTPEFEALALESVKIRWVVDVAKIAEPLAGGNGIVARLFVPFEGYRRGARLRLGTLAHTPAIRLHVTADADIMVGFLRDGELVGEVHKAGMPEESPDFLPVIVVGVPEAVREIGFDEVLVVRDDDGEGGRFGMVEFRTRMPEGGPTPDRIAPDGDTKDTEPPDGYGLPIH